MNFLYFSPRFCKMDIYKCPFLKSALRDLKFAYIITSSASALPNSAGLPLCCYSLKYLLYIYDHYAQDAMIAKGAHFFYKDGME